MINLNLFIVSVNLKKEKRYILSTCKDEICIPQVPMESLDKDKLKIDLSEYIRRIIPMHILGIIPQVITLHSPNLSAAYKKKNPEQYDPSNIECIYGCLVDHINPAKEDFFWIEFSYHIPNDYSSNIFEVCQNLT